MKKFYNIHTIWLLLLLLTVSTYLLGYLNYGSITVMSVLVITAAIQGIVIMREFMELRGVSLLWRVIMYGWLISVCVVIIITYIIGIN